MVSLDRNVELKPFGNDPQSEYRVSDPSGDIPEGGSSHVREVMLKNLFDSHEKEQLTLSNDGSTDFPSIEWKYIDRYESAHSP